MEYKCKITFEGARNNILFNQVKHDLERTYKLDCKSKEENKYLYVLDKKRPIFTWIKKLFSRSKNDEENNSE